ncbi:MAG TPA: hypothetical protein VF730_00490 [Terracidiphilus sp.]
MESHPPVAVATAVAAAKPARLASDLVYQGMTLAAMLWLLASLWAF